MPTNREAFLREKAFLDSLPPTPPLPILSPTGSATPTTAYAPTTPFPSTTSADPTLHHSSTTTNNNKTSSYFQPQPHPHHTYTSLSAPHLSASTTLASSLSGPPAPVHHQHSVPHLHPRTPDAHGGDPKRPRSHRFSATINLLRGSWNSSHPVSAADTDVFAPRRPRSRLWRTTTDDGDGRRGGGRWEFVVVGGGGANGDDGDDDGMGKEHGFEMQVVEGGGGGGGGGGSVRSVGRDSDVTLRGGEGEGKD